MFYKKLITVAILAQGFYPRAYLSRTLSPPVAMPPPPVTRAAAPKAVLSASFAVRRRLQGQLKDAKVKILAALIVKKCAALPADGDKARRLFTNGLNSKFGKNVRKAAVEEARDTLRNALFTVTSSYKRKVNGKVTHPLGKCEIVAIRRTPRDTASEIASTQDGASTAAEDVEALNLQLAEVMAMREADIENSVEIGLDGFRD
jgi:hypothetical protein